MIFCVPKHLIDKIKTSQLAKETNIKDLYNMSSKERRAFFAKHTDDEVGKFINTEFEKASISKQKTALKDWAEGVFSPKEKQGAQYKTVLDKINNLEKAGLLNDKNKQGFLEDLISDKLGIGVTAKEVRMIEKKAIKIQKIQKKLGDNFGNVIDNFDDNLEFLKAKKEMDDMLLGFNPASRAKVFSGTIARGSMLASVKSPILNIGSNTINGVLEGFSRRLSSLQARGANNKLALDYIKKVNKIYQKTGYDISRAISDDFGASGSRVLGDIVHAQGKGTVRKVGRFFEDTVFKQLMGAPDVAYSSAHFADTVNLGSMKLAKGDKKKATQYMLDAMSLDPKTDAGKLLKAQGILDAQVATYTNKSAISKASEGLRNILNDIAPEARIGDWVMPFVKTPANVINTSLDYAGLGAVKGVAKMAKMIANKNLTQAGVQEAVRDMVRAGMGGAGALLIANQIDPENFVGAYDPARKQIEALRNSNSNSIRIGDKWISLDWFGPLGVPLAGIMYAKKYSGGTKTGGALAYSKGIGRQLLQVPGFEVLNDTYDDLSKKGKEVSLEDTGKSIQKSAFDNLYGRLVPSIFSDVAKATDVYEREATTTGEKLKAKVPFLREILPVKKNVFGEDVTGEPAWSDILLGARVKTSKETEMVKKINKLVDASGKNLSLTDWDTTTGKQLNEAKTKLGKEEYDKLKVEYGKQLKQELETLMSSNKFNMANETAKINMINSLDEKIIKTVLKTKGIIYK